VNYRSLRNLTRLISNRLGTLPTDIEAVVGVPRSGALVANMIGLQLSRPVVTVGNVVRKDPLEGGIRLGMRPDQMETFLQKPRRLLVVDDSCGTGYTIRITKEAIAKSGVKHSCSYLAPYVTSNGKLYVDFWFEELPKPRFFEWNWATHVFLTTACVDIDGVLCRDPLPGEMDEETNNGMKYHQFINTVPVLRRLRQPLRYLVTCRLEKWRPQTERWLKRNGIKYKRLVMMDVKTVRERKKIGHAVYKSHQYRKLGGSAFVESSYGQAVQIHKRTKKPVFCVETMELFK
jgi:orotate phosphoribosyltransferase